MGSIISQTALRTTTSGKQLLVPIYSADQSWVQAFTDGGGISTPDAKNIWKYWEDNPFLQNVQDAYARNTQDYQGARNEAKARKDPYGNSTNPNGTVTYQTNFFRGDQFGTDPFADERLGAIAKQRSGFQQYTDEGTGLQLGKYNSYDLKKDLGPLQYRQAINDRSGPYGQSSGKNFKTVSTTFGDANYQAAWDQENAKFKLATSHTSKQRVVGGSAAYNNSPAGRMTVNAFNPLTANGFNPYQGGIEYSDVAMSKAQLNAKGLDHFNTAGLAGYEGKYDTTEKKGIFLNGAFVDEDVFDKMNDQQRATYGQTWNQAFANDEKLGKIGSILPQAYQSVRADNKSSGGFGSILKSAIGIAAPIVGGFLGGPIGAGIGSGFATATQGGSFGDILKNGALAYAGGSLAKIGGGSLPGGGSPYSDGGNLGGAIQGATNGAGNVSFLDDLFKGGSKIVGDIKGSFSDIFKGGTGGFTDFLSGNGSAGGLGDLINFASGGKSGGIGNILSGITNGNLGQILNGAGGLGAFNSLLGGGGLQQQQFNPVAGGGGSTPGFNPTAGGGGGGPQLYPQPFNPGAGAGGGGAGGLPPFIQQLLGSAGGAGGIGDLLKTLGSGALAEHSTGEVRDEIKSGRDRAIALADPLASQRPEYARQLGALMADPSSVTSLPGYEFRRQQGQEAMQRTLDAGGYKESGNALIAATEYGQNFAQNAYDAEFQKLLGLSSGNQTAAEAASRAGTQLAYLEQGKYSDYLGLAQQQFGLPSPTGPQYYPGQQQQQTQPGQSVLDPIMQQTDNIQAVLGDYIRRVLGGGNGSGDPYSDGGNLGGAIQ